MGFNLEDVIIKGVDDIAPGTGNCVEAVYYGEGIGYIYFDAIPNCDGDVAYVIPHIANVECEYQRKGVGTKIVEEVSLSYSIKATNSSNNVPDDKDDIHYSEEGMSFIEACADKGLLKCDDEADDLYFSDEFFDEDL